MGRWRARAGAGRAATRRWARRLLLRLPSGPPRWARRLGRAVRGEGGQMTVELMVALPVMVVIALIAFNALTFFGLCAEYDRVARNAVRVYAAAPTSLEGAEAAGEVSAAIEANLGCPTAESTVEASLPHLAPATFTCSLAYHPTLFGLGVRSEVLGVALPPLRHTVALSTFVYNPLC